MIARSVRVARCLRTLFVVSAIFATPVAAHASKLWNWSYSGTGIDASGTFTTNDTPNAQGFYQITGITGTRNGGAIIELQPTGTPIPGNEPYAVDNLVSAGPVQLTAHGFGFSTAAGTYANPFYADFLAPPGYLEFFSAPPFAPGKPGPEDSELPVTFTASLATETPEPASALLLVVGMAGLAAVTRKRAV